MHSVVKCLINFTNDLKHMSPSRSQNGVQKVERRGSYKAQGRKQPEATQLVCFDSRLALWQSFSLPSPFLAQAAEQVGVGRGSHSLRNWFHRNSWFPIWLSSQNCYQSISFSLISSQTSATLHICCSTPHATLTETLLREKRGPVSVLILTLSAAPAPLLSSLWAGAEYGAPLAKPPHHPALGSPHLRPAHIPHSLNEPLGNFTSSLSTSSLCSNDSRL